MGRLPYEIKDWSHWKVADYPELQEVEQQLAKKGLKNPWLRNECWRFQETLRPIGLRKTFFRGFPIGLGAFLIAVGIETYRKQNKDSDGHH